MKISLLTIHGRIGITFCLVLALWFAACGEKKNAQPEVPKAESKPKETVAPEAQTAIPREESAPATEKQKNQGSVSASPRKVSGTVRFEGEAPKRIVIKMDNDPKCKAMHGDEKVGTEAAIVSADGKVANAFVYVKSGLEGKKFDPPEEPATIDQRGCIYIPHVQGIFVGQKFNIVSSDPTLHNIHGLAKINPEFNHGQPAPGTIEKVFHKPEIGLKIKCDVHPWMNAWVHVMEHPFFAVSAKDGTYGISNLPPGNYTLAAWHERFGELEKKISVGNDAATDADFTFSEPKKK